MRSSTLAAAIVAPMSASAVSFASGPISFPGHTGVPVGRDVDLSWIGDGSPVDLALLQGPTNNLTKVEDIEVEFQGVTNAAGQQSYTWTVDDAIDAGDYVVSIHQSNSVDYTPQFTIESNDDVGLFARDNDDDDTVASDVVARNDSNFSALLNTLNSTQDSDKPPHYTVTYHGGEVADFDLVNSTIDVTSLLFLNETRDSKVAARDIEWGHRRKHKGKKGKKGKADLTVSEFFFVDEATSTFTPRLPPNIQTVSTITYIPSGTLTRTVHESTLLGFVTTLPAVPGSTIHTFGRYFATNLAKRDNNMVERDFELLNVTVTDQYLTPTSTVQPTLPPVTVAKRDFKLVNVTVTDQYLTPTSTVQPTLPPVTVAKRDAKKATVTETDTVTTTGPYPIRTVTVTKGRGYIHTASAVEGPPVFTTELVYHEWDKKDVNLLVTVTVTDPYRVPTLTVQPKLPPFVVTDTTVTYIPSGTLTKTAHVTETVSFARTVAPAPRATVTVLKTVTVTAAPVTKFITVTELQTQLTTVTQLETPKAQFTVTEFVAKDIATATINPRPIHFHEVPGTSITYIPHHDAGIATTKITLARGYVATAEALPGENIRMVQKTFCDDNGICQDFDLVQEIAFDKKKKKNVGVGLRVSGMSGLIIVFASLIWFF